MLAAIGCSPLSLGKRGLDELRGASGDFHIVRDANPAEIGEYTSVAIGAVDTDLGSLCPEELVETLAEALRTLPDALKEHYPGGEPALNIDATILWYQESGGVKAVLGQDALCIVRTHLHSEQGETVADLRLIASSGAITRAGHEDLAEAIAKALADYLRTRVPERSSPPAT